MYYIYIINKSKLDFTKVFILSTLTMRIIAER